MSDYSKENPLWSQSPADTFSPNTHPCTSANYVPSRPLTVSSRALFTPSSQSPSLDARGWLELTQHHGGLACALWQALVSACCLASFNDMYRPMASFPTKLPDLAVCTPGLPPWYDSSLPHHPISKLSRRLFRVLTTRDCCVSFLQDARSLGGSRDCACVCAGPADSSRWSPLSRCAALLDHVLNSSDMS
eukprot:532714-Rhodomonas_salina.2